MEVYCLEENCIHSKEGDCQKANVLLNNTHVCSSFEAKK